MATIEIAFMVCGGPGNLAKRLGAPQQVVTNWRRRGIPAARVLDVVRACRGAVTPFELDPVLYPDPRWMPSDVAGDDAAGHVEAVGE